MGVILIAYERESEQNTLEQLLSGRGHQIVRSSNGLAALDAARREPPNLVVSDIVLPRMDGFALCRKWKQDERLQAIPFVFYTRRHDDPKYERFALELGAERFLARSMQPDALLTAVDELLANVPKTCQTQPLQAMDTASFERMQSELVQQTQTQAIEQAKQLQARLRTELAELQSSNQQLTLGEARFRRVFEANPAPMWIADCATEGFIAVNDAAVELFGYSRSEFLLLKLPDLLAPDKGAQPGSNAIAHKRKEGAVLQLVVAGREIEFDGRRAQLVSAYDLTSRLAAEQASRQEAESNRRDMLALRMQQRQMEFLVDMFRQADSFDETAIIRRMIEQACDTTRSPLAYLFFVQPEEGTLTLAAWRERNQSYSTTATADARPLASSLFTECVRARRAVSSNDLSWKPQTDGLPELQRYLAVPMIVEDATVAVLGVANRDAGYEEQDQRALASLAEGVWRMLQNKRSHAQTLMSLQRIDVAMQGMIDALLKLAEKHDPYSAGSARRVAALAVALGREAGLDGERQHALRVAALLHDIGHVAIPVALLSKPGPHTVAEEQLMQVHVEEGCKLLADIDFGAPIAQIVYEHHERYDGSGYPRGLKGEEILLEARILAIADVVEAMCSQRPHRTPLGIEAALEEINRGAGKLYEQNLATACIRLFRQHGFRMTDQ